MKNFIEKTIAFAFLFLGIFAYAIFNAVETFYLVLMLLSLVLIGMFITAFYFIYKKFNNK